MDLVIRPVAPSEVSSAFAVLRELRPHLDIETFSARLQRQRAHGYELHGAFIPELIGLIGFRPVETMARGQHLHVDDLVVTKAFQRQGVGHALLAFVESLARRHSFVALFLDSRPEVIDFYHRLGFAEHTATLMRKRIIAEEPPNKAVNPSGGSGVF